MNDFHFTYINLYPCNSGFTTDTRIFDYDYLLYVHSGKGFYKIGNTTYSACMGDLFYCPPFTGNTITADKEDPFVLSGIEFCAPDYRNNLKKKFSLLPHPFLSQSIKEMVQECRYMKKGYKDICGALLISILENLTRISNEPEFHKGSLAVEILNYITTNYQRQITHQELSQIFSCHKNTINRILLRETGLSLKNYVIDLRIRKACDLLKYSDKFISEISELCGYNSTVFFSRQFHQKTGMSPLHFRKNIYSKRQK